MTADAQSWRARLVDAVKANPVVTITDRDLLDRLTDPSDDCSFEELGFDSLARMELCIWLQIEHGVEIADRDVLDHPCLNALAAYLAVHAE